MSTSAPLSFAQEALLASRDLTRAVVPVYLRVRGVLDVSALHRAVALVVARHPALAMRLVADDGSFRQVFDTGRVPPFDVVGLDDASPSVLGTAVMEFAAEPMDPFQGDSFRCRVVRLGHDDHLVLLNMHHLYADGWGVKVVLQELWQGYDAYAADDEPRLPRPGADYGGYAAYERMSGRTLTDEQRAFWREAMKDNVSARLTPEARTEPISEPRVAQCIEQSLSPDELQRIVAFGRLADVTPSSALLTSVLLALRRMCAQDDLTVTFVSSGRDDRRFARTLGLFSRRLPLRVRVDSGMTLEKFATSLMGSWSSAVSQSKPPYSFRGLRDFLGLHTHSCAHEVRGEDVELQVNFPVFPAFERLTRSDLLIEGIEMSQRKQTLDQPRLMLGVRYANKVVASAVFNDAYVPSDTVRDLLGHFADQARNMTPTHRGHTISELDQLMEAEIWQRQ
nr:MULTISPECIES: condensation domain-containing protein [Streptomyces]